MSENNFKLKIQAVLDKVRSIANIQADIKAIEPKLPKLKIQGTLDSAKTKRDLNAKVKTITPKIKVDADTSKAVQKIRKLGRQRTTTTIQPTVDNTQVISSLRAAQKETKSLFDRFINGVIGVNLIRMSVQKITQAIYQAITAIKELDRIKTNIQMVSKTTDSEVNSMMSSYNAMAKQLSSTTKEVASAANEFLRMGESISNTNELIKSSQILSKTGMIESSNAASYLISSLKGYQIAAEDSIGIVDKLTAVDLEAAVSAGGLAEAMSRCANIANSSGTSMDRLIGYMATVGEVTQDSMSLIGNSFKSIYSRMNNIKIGRFIDDETGESLSDTEAVLNKLGIKLRDTEDTYRDFDDVLDDVGTRWKDFTQVERNAISVAFAGTMQRERFIALMNNYSNALKYSETAANSAGSALERYGVYQDSIEAKTNELTAAIESLSTNTISENLFSGIIEATTSLVTFIDKANILKGTLAGLVAMGVSKAFVSISTGIITAAKSTAQLTAAMALFDKGRSKQNLLAIGAACKGLSDNQLKLILFTKGLTNEDRTMILAGMGVAETEREQTLTTLGFAAAEDKATVSTFSLKGAFNALKTAIATNPIGAIVTAVTTATIVFSWFKQNQEELLQSAKEAADAYKDSSSSIDDYVSKYKELREQLIAAKGNEEETYRVKSRLLELQKELNEMYGDTYGRINLVTDAYKDQTDVLKSYNKEAAQIYLNENKKGIDKASSEMTKTRNYRLGNSAELSNENAQKVRQEILDLTSEFDNIEIAASGIIFTGTVTEADETINAFMTKVRELQEGYKGSGQVIQNVFDDVLDSSTNALKKVNSVLETYQDVYATAQITQIASNDNLSKGYNEAVEAVEEYNQAVLKSEDPYNDENVKKAWDSLQTVKQGIQDNEEEWGQYSNIMDNVFAEADDVIYSFYQKMQNDDSISKLTDDLKGLSDVDLQSMADDDLEDSFDKLYESASKYGLEVQDVIDLLIKLGYVQGQVSNGVSDETALSYESLTKTAESATESVDTLRSAISSVNDAFAEQEENGSVSVDTMLAMAEAGYATALQFDSVTGACTINKEAMLDLVQAKIQNQIADLQLLQSNIQQKLADDGNTARESANGFYDLAKAKLAAASAEQLASMKQFNDAEAQINALQNASKNIKKIGAGSYSTKAKSSSSSKSSSDPLKDSFTQEYNTLKHNLDMEYITEKQYYDSLDALNQKYFAGKSEYLDEYRQYEEEVYKGLKSYYKDYIESQMNLLESQLDAGVINYKHYSSTVKSLLDNMFSDAKISAVDYHKYIQEMLNKQLDIYDKVLSAVTNRFDKEIDKINAAIDGIEKQNDALEEQKSLMESAADAVVSYYDSLTDAEQQSIDNLEAKNDSIQEQINKYDSLISVADKVYDGEQKSLEEQQNLLQEKIDALNDENDALDLQYRKEQALIALRRAQTQRTKKVKYMPAITVM